MLAISTLAILASFDFDLFDIFQLATSSITVEPTLTLYTVLAPFIVPTSVIVPTHHKFTLYQTSRDKEITKSYQNRINSFLLRQSV